MRIVLLGAPGTGKGTQGEKLSAHFAIPTISTGDLLRQAVADQTALGVAAKTAMDAGQLVADDIVVGMIRERLAEPDTQNGFILDGFPRSNAQSETLDALLQDIGKPLHRVVHLDVPNSEIMDRLLARKRADDTEDTIRNRLSVYEAQTRPVVDYYRAAGKLAVVEGVGSIDEIYARILDALS